MASLLPAKAIPNSRHQITSLPLNVRFTMLKNAVTKNNVIVAVILILLLLMMGFLLLRHSLLCFRKVCKMTLDNLLV